MIKLEQFDEIQMRVGTIIAISPNKRAKKPAYKITVDLGKLELKQVLRRLQIISLMI